MIEKKISDKGYDHIAGVDEAGRGPLAGPVTAAAVILPKNRPPHIFAGIRDSKQLTESARERLETVIKENALCWAVVDVSPQDIDTINIRQASLLAMKKAVEQLTIPPDYVLVDGRDYPAISFPGEPVIKGDQRCVSIGAASILAKVSRDRLLDRLHDEFPNYGLLFHKGYPTKYHKTAVRLFGPSPLHRRSFRGVAECLQKQPWSGAFQCCMENMAQSTNIDALETMYKHIVPEQMSPDEVYYLQHRIKYQLNTLKQQNRQQKPANVDIGAKWETEVISLLEEKGYRFVERNFVERSGEIDLILTKDSMLVFVEVKARRSSKFGLPHEAVTYKKQQAIIHTADEYIYKRGCFSNLDIRYDVVSVINQKGQPCQIDHFEDAFRAEEKLF